MFRRLVQALRRGMRTPEVRLSLVVNPAAVVEPQGVRCRMILGGKVIDLIRESATSKKEPKNELDVE